MIQNIFLVLLFLTGNSCTSAITNPGGDNSGDIKSGEVLIAFYNVENLFDTLDDPLTDDSEFLPSGKNHWTTEKYEKKISNIARVIAAMKEGKGADIIGLCETENKKVLDDLVADPKLRKLNYGIVHHESPDLRGIDVSMIYKKNVLKILSQQPLRVDISSYDEKPTRDVLLVAGIIGKDTVYFFLNHWPSRRGGTKETEPRRIAAANAVKRASDSLLLKHPQANMIIMGDFNDNPTDQSVSRILGAKPQYRNQIAETPSSYLCNPTNLFDWKRGEGSEFYRGDWSRFIQFIISCSMMPSATTDSVSHIYLFKPSWLLKQDDSYQQMIPQRMFEDDGTLGFSDHLPVYMIFHFRKHN